MYMPIKKQYIGAYICINMCYCNTRMVVKTARTNWYGRF